MKRFAMENLIKWKMTKTRKPLIIRGARQVGKTWLMQEFGKNHYEKIIYINFDTDQTMASLFSRDLDIERILRGIELMHSGRIDPHTTLLIFDEIQEAPKALSSLKYFYEKYPELHIIAAGSLLGVALHQGTSFPVGKVDFLDLYPLSYKEFLWAMDKNNLVELLNSGDFALANVFKQDFIETLKIYYYVGGMPEVVFDFAENHDYERVRIIQHSLLDAYELDFSKHAPTAEIPRIRMLWNNIPSQLAKENKKFIYGQIRTGARSKDYELALMWLKDRGLLHQVKRISKPGLPLKAYEDLKAFKLYSLDVGLLACQSVLDVKTLLIGDAVFTEFKGALTEQFICQELKTTANFPINYWTNDAGSAEIDFVIQYSDKVIPIEVKAELNLQAKSLSVYRSKYEPELSIRSSMADYRLEEGLLDLPLWAISELPRVIADLSQ